MPSRPDPRLLWALLLAVGTGALVAIFAESVQGGLIAGVGGVAAALMAGLERPEPEASRADVDGDEAPPMLAALLDAIVQPVMLVRAGKVLLANRTARGELGAHIVGEDVRVAIRHPAAAARLAQADAAADRPIELVGLGSVERRWEMLVHEAGRFRVVQLIDRTGHHAAERMRVDFVANASHELRTPLASILGFIETLSDEAGDDREVRARFLRVMFDEARRMQRLVEDLISLSRIEAEKHRLPDDEVDLAELVMAVRAEIVDGGSDPERVVTAAMDADLPAVCGDEARLSQMVHNLVGNALKYGRPGTPVTVSLHRDGGMVRLTVADEGEGIAPEHIPRLTERFYRVDAGRSRAMGGTGLGLAIVKHIVERHRGRLDIVSKPGVGTTVTVLLPPAGAVTKA